MGNAFAESVLQASTRDHAHARGGRFSRCVNLLYYLLAVVRP